MVRLITFTLLTVFVLFFVINGWYLRKDMDENKTDPFEDGKSEDSSDDEADGGNK